MNHLIKPPVLFLVFNRPETTIRVFEQIRTYKPTQLFIAADGARENKIGEAEKCEVVRKIATQIDWDCEVKTLFREKNLGCKAAVSGAINWFFENVEEGIILEDDCLPNESFFLYCQTMLERYRNNDNVMHINGFTYSNEKTNYHFTNLPLVWGWASWRRAWLKYDIEMTNIETGFKKMDKLVSSNYFYSSAMKLLSLEVFFNEINTWDVQWNFSVIKNNGICVQTGVNFISNIGYGADATHTICENDVNSNRKTIVNSDFINYFPLLNVDLSQQFLVLNNQYKRSWKGKIRIILRYYLYIFKLKIKKINNKYFLKNLL